MAPSYANLFVSYVEKYIVKPFTGPIPDLFGTSIDDCCYAMLCSRTDVKRLITFVNNFHPALKFVREISESCAPI